MIKYVVYTCRFNVCDMFDKTFVMSSRGMDEFLLMWLLSYHCHIVIEHPLSFHEVMGSDLGFGPEKVAQIMKLQAKNWSFGALTIGIL